jgi:hypothetical protein
VAQALSPEQATQALSSEQATQALSSEQVAQALSSEQATQALSSEQVAQALAQLDRLQYLNVALLQNELQVAVDGPKSARRPDEAIYQFCTALANYRDVSWIRAKKDPQVYLEQVIPSTGYSSIDKTIAIANQFYRDFPLLPRPAEQFRSLFPQPAEALIEEARKIRAEYQIYERLAAEIRTLRQKHPETVDTYLEVTSQKSGRTLYISHASEFLEPGSPPQGGTMTLRLQENPDQQAYNRLLAFAVQTNAQGKEITTPVGTVAESSRRQFDLKAGTFLQAALTTLHPGARTPL